MERQGFDLPLLIGGATTSRAHTAVKVDPQYHGPVVWVKDASRSVPIVAALLSDERRPALLGGRRRPTTTRCASGTRPSAPSGRCVSHRGGPRNATPIDWTGYRPPVRHLVAAQAQDLPRRQSAHRPQATQFIRTFNDYPLDELRDVHRLEPFFLAWEMKGRFPDMLHNPATARPRRKLYEDAQRMLDRIIDEKWLRASGVLGLFPANVGRRRPRGLHRRVARDGARPRCTPAPAGPAPRGHPATARCRDFVAPKDSGLRRLRRRVRRHGRARLARTGRRVQGRPRRLRRDPAGVAGRPAGRGVRRAAAPARPPRVLGLRARRAPAATTT